MRLELIRWRVTVRSAIRLALTSCALAVPYCAWGMEGTVYLPGPIPRVLSLRVEVIPSDADLPVDWRTDPAPDLAPDDSQRVYADTRSTTSQ